MKYSWVEDKVWCQNWSCDPGFLVEHRAGWTFIGELVKKCWEVRLSLQILCGKNQPCFLRCVSAYWRWALVGQRRHILRVLVAACGSWEASSSGNYCFLGWKWLGISVRGCSRYDSTLRFKSNYRMALNGHEVCQKRVWCGATSPLLILSLEYIFFCQWRNP